MFKSVFAKYVTVLMVIITFGFALLLLVVTSIVSNYSVTAKETLLKNVAGVTQIEVESVLEDNGITDFREYLDSGDTDRIQTLLDAFRGHDDDFAILLANKSGTVLHASLAENSRFTVDSLLQTDLPTSLLQGVGDKGLFQQEILLTDQSVPTTVCAVGIYDDNGNLLGIVAACAADSRWGIAVTDLIKTVVTSALLVLLAALIAAYFITERTIAPLRQMRTAARSFAAGNFEARVVVRGKDEVAELADAFNQMAESLENLENMRSSFIANVSHDLRTPMTTIAGFVDGILDGVIPEKDHAHYLEVISLEVRRLSRLVSSLLDLSRIQAGDRKFTMKNFDICEMARLILISFEKKIEEKHLEVEFEVDDDRMIVLGDRDAIHQVFYNICHNAVKFSKEGGRLRIRLENTREKKICVSVYNEGEGIPTEDQPLIFERFYKSDKSRGLDKTGVGLGLYISKAIISAHGEKIWVSSKPGKDCEFSFTLPHGM